MAPTIFGTKNEGGHSNAVHPLFLFRTRRTFAEPPPSSQPPYPRGSGVDIFPGLSDLCSGTLGTSLFQRGPLNTTQYLFPNTREAMFPSQRPFPLYFSLQIPFQGPVFFLRTSLDIIYDLSLFPLRGLEPFLHIDFFSKFVSPVAALQSFSQALIP